jgi:hypothetical protein
MAIYNGSLSMLSAYLLSTVAAVAVESIPRQK